MNADALPSTLLVIVYTVIEFYIFVIFAAVIASWLIAFGVVNLRNEAVRLIVQTLNALTEPAFRRIRRIISPIGGLDLSPLIVLVALYALRYFLVMAFPQYGYHSFL